MRFAATRLHTLHAVISIHLLLPSGNRNAFDEIAVVHDVSIEMRASLSTYLLHLRRSSLLIPRTALTHSLLA
jgi:hypothetical protein